MTQLPAISAAALLATTLATTNAQASPRGVGLGVAAGVDHSQADTILDGDSSTSFAWGFFVDIPLLETFVIAPQTTIYELSFAGSDDRNAITDVGLNFKFRVPLDSMALGFGVLAGLTTGLGDYKFHYGAVGQLTFDLVANIDGFLMAQYKRIDVGAEFGNEDISKIHGFAGAMFEF